MLRGYNMDKTSQDFKLVARTDVKTADEVIRQWWQVADLPKKEVYEDDLPSVFRGFFRVKDRLDETAFTLELKVKEENGAASISLCFLYDLYARTSEEVMRETVCGLASEFKKRNIEHEVRTGFLLRKKMEC